MSKKKKNKQSDDGTRIVDVNKKAHRDYEILDTLEAGLVLLGSEVKSIRGNGISLRDSYIRFRNGKCVLVACHIAPYAFSKNDAHDPYRERELLLHKRELERLNEQVQAKGRTLVPLKAYFNKRGRCKLAIGLGRGKKLHDKRQDVKKKEAAREMERAVKTHRY